MLRPSNRQLSPGHCVLSQSFLCGKIDRQLPVDFEAVKSLQVARVQAGPKSMRRSPPQDMDGRYRR